MFFSNEQVEMLHTRHAEIVDRRRDILLRYMEYDFRRPKAREYATHGFCRRIDTLVRCIDRVFEIIPPELNYVPNRGDVSDAVIYVQAFVFNVFGSVDNLAWIWVIEKGIVKKDGSPLPHVQVGLSGKKNVVRRSFSEDFQAYLDERKEWFDLLDEFRHALAHRIPLYIPPFVIPDEKNDTYYELDRGKADAVTRLDFDEYDRLNAEQMVLVAFAPVMTHSLEERAKRVVFHGQMMNDFLTIEELGLKFLEELTR